jgi:hypothetical protein
VDEREVDYSATSNHGHLWFGCIHLVWYNAYKWNLFLSEPTQKCEKLIVEATSCARAIAQGHQLKGCNLQRGKVNILVNSGMFVCAVAYRGWWNAITSGQVSGQFVCMLCGTSSESSSNDKRSLMKSLSSSSSSPSLSS